MTRTYQTTYVNFLEGWADQEGVSVDDVNFMQSACIICSNCDNYALRPRNTTHSFIQWEVSLASMTLVTLFAFKYVSMKVNFEYLFAGH